MLKKMKVTIIPDTLPRTWQEILNAFSPAEVRSFPMRGQALINVRHVIARMHGGSGKLFRTLSKGERFYIICTGDRETVRMLSEDTVRRMITSIREGMITDRTASHE